MLQQSNKLTEGSNNDRLDILKVEQVEEPYHENRALPNRIIDLDVSFMIENLANNEGNLPITIFHTHFHKTEFLRTTETSNEKILEPN